LYLEFITWLLGGWGLVKEFEKKRMSFDPMWYDIDTDAFFELVQCDNNKRPGVIAAMVKPAVTEVRTRPPLKLAGHPTDMSNSLSKSFTRTSHVQTSYTTSSTW
jgi:hypothetical protein